MADKPQGIEGDIHGKPLSNETKQKIQEVLKSALDQELSKETKTAGVTPLARPTHGSVTHGSVTKAL